MLLILFYLTCVCQATKENDNEILNPESEYDKVAVFNFDDIEYLFLGYQVTFDEARVICLNYKAQLAFLNTKEKADFIARAMTSTFELGEFWIGAQSDNTDSWYWIDKKQKFNLDDTFYGDLKIWDSLGFNSNNENCLTVYRKRHNSPRFVPLRCSKKRPFICQRETDRFGMKVNEIDVTKMNDEKFTLYSARATWAEAVVQCRQKGMQIAEVKSKKVAQAVAMSMLRARPDAIENVWIGGYLKENSWEWLASSDEITVNELWPNDTKLLTGCLLLDRHVCEDPVYVSANCERKRHILCQKPPIKLISKKPSPINVNGCTYWVGFYPLQWLDASRSCQAVNASLVILDSPKIVDHMMTLMADYKEELRHIWTDGHRLISKTSLEQKTYRKDWYWSSTGERVPISGSFIPWCTAQDNTKNTNCLNLDRENHKTPVVYGLSCRKNQTYVCQPWKGHCVSHRVQEDLLKNSEFLNLYSSLADIKQVKTPTIALSLNSSRETEEDVSYVYEDMNNMKKFHNTASYYTSSVAYSIPHQVTSLLEATMQSITEETKKIDEIDDNSPKDDEENYDNEKEIERIKPNKVNQTNSQNFVTDFFSPLIQFTLPSLPQFGIKVVSAAVTTPKSKDKKISVLSKSQETTAKNVTGPATIYSRTQVTKNTVKNFKKTSSNLKQKKGRTSKNVTSTVIDKNLGSAKNVPRTKVESFVTEKVNIITTSEATEKKDSLSSGRLYGEDIDYFDTSSSKAENIERTKPSEGYNGLIKSLEASGKFPSLLNEGKGSSNLYPALPFVEVLRKRINDEIKSALKLELQSELKNTSQESPVEFSLRKTFKNPGITNEAKYQLKSMDTEHMEMSKNQNNQRPFTHDLISPYYAFESPLKVELLDNGTGVPISPIVPKFYENTTPQTVENNDSAFDFQLSNFETNDKDSMLQLGRFLKNMFAGNNSNAQKIDFNLIARRDLSVTSQIINESENNFFLYTNNIQETISQNENNSQITTTIDTTAPQSVYENKSSINCQKELENLQKITSCKTASNNLETENSQELGTNLPVLTLPALFRMPRMSSENRSDYSYQDNDPKVESSLFNVFKDLVKGIRIDVKEMQLKNYVSRFIRERLPNPEEFDFDSDSVKSWHNVFKRILNSLNGTAIRFHGEKVQLRFGSFGYKKKSKPKFKFVAHLETTASPEIYDYAIRGLQTRHEITDAQDQIQQIQNPWKNLDHSGISDDLLNITHESTYVFSPLQSKSSDFSNEKKHNETRNISNIRRLKHKSTSEIDQPDHLEFNLNRWSHIRNQKEKLKNRNQVEERESMQEKQDFKYKMFPPSENWKHRTLSSDENVQNTKNLGSESSYFNKMKLQIGSKLSKKSITEANQENPFPDFPVVNFDMRRAEHSFENGFETIRVGRASKHGDFRDELSIVSVYIVMKHHNNVEGEKYSIPIFELHIRVPANSLPLDEKYNLDYRTRRVDRDQIRDSQASSNPTNLDSKIIQKALVTRRRKTTQEPQITQRKTTQEPKKKLKSRKSRKLKIHRRKKQGNQNRLEDLDLQDKNNHTNLNYEKENNFLRNIIQNVTNFKTVPDLKRKRQLLYIVLKYLRRVTDERLKEQSKEDEKNSLQKFMKHNNENRQINFNPMPKPNLRGQVPVLEVQNLQPVPLYPGFDNRMVLNPVENELNKKRGLFNQLPFFNYNTRRYDDMPFNIIKRSYNTRMRRNVESPKNSKSRLFFLNKEGENQNYNSNQ